MGRLPQWDYRRPYFYMVTLKCLPNLPPLSRLSAEDTWGYDYNYPLTKALAETIKTFLANSPGLESLSPYVIMPDHLHLLVKIANVPERQSLPVYVRILKALLRKTFCAATGLTTPLFEPEWHDLIVKDPKHLANFRNYIRNNPKMLLLRRQHRDLFHCYRNFQHWRLGEQCYDLVGNPELLKEPAMLAVRISRSVKEGTPEWEKMISFYSRWRPGMTAIGTWWSPGEKAAYKHILARGGNILLLSPEGFPERWHPAGTEAQQACSTGHLLFLSPYAASTNQHPVGETRRRCLELNAFSQAIAQTSAPSAPVR